MKQKSFWVIGLLVVIAVSAYLFYRQSPPAVPAVAVQEGDIRATIEETGYIQAREEYPVQALEAGRIAELNLKRGQAVEPGELLFTLHSLELDGQFAALDEHAAATQTEVQMLALEYQATEIKLQQAQEDLIRQGELLAAGAISQADFDLALQNKTLLESALKSQEDIAQSMQNQLLTLESQRQELAKKAQRLHITSPLKGVVQTVHVKAGQLVGQGEVLAQIAAADQLEVRIDVLSADMGSVVLGQAVEVDNASLDRPLTGEIIEIYPQAHEKVSSLGVPQRRVTVIAALEESAWLKPGYEVTVNIITAAKTSVPLLPREAVVITDRQAGEVNRIIAGQVVKQPVELGLRNQEYVEIVSGLQLHDLVIQDASLYWEPGGKVEAVVEEARETKE